MASKQKSVIIYRVREKKNPINITMRKVITLSTNFNFKTSKKLPKTRIPSIYIDRTKEKKIQ